MSAAMTLLRLRTAIKTCGDTFTISGNTFHGVFTVISPARAAHFMTQALVDGSTRPIRMVFVRDDCTAVANDVVTWDGSTLIVKRVVNLRVKGSTVAKMLILG